jgi:hypothetical protein
MTLTLTFFFKKKFGTNLRNSNTYLLWGWNTHPQLVGDWGQEDLKHNDVECVTQKAKWFRTITFTRQR